MKVLMTANVRAAMTLVLAAAKLVEMTALTADPITAAMTDVTFNSCNKYYKIKTAIKAAISSVTTTKTKTAVTTTSTTVITAAMKAAITAEMIIDVTAANTSQMTVPLIA